jgi:hypothetical protein
MSRCSAGALSHILFSSQRLKYFYDPSSLILSFIWEKIISALKEYDAMMTWMMFGDDNEQFATT